MIVIHELLRSGTNYCSLLISTSSGAVVCKLWFENLLVSSENMRNGEF
jgi:hypothetical protein